MRLSEIKNRYITFHQRHGYKLMPDVGIVPDVRDDTTFFTTSGMQSLRTRYENPFNSWTPQTSFQTCLRTDDIDEVGYTDRHLSLFTMLGCFKWQVQPSELKKILSQGWQLLTEEYSLDKTRLHVTVYGGDSTLGYKSDELTYNTWLELGIKPSHLHFGGEDNYWLLGPDSVGGPCTEIIYDRGETKGCLLPTCNVFCGCDRYLEIYNLVLTQYQHSNKNNREHLGCLNLDTGLGLERLGLILQEVECVQETDIYWPFWHLLQFKGSTLQGKQLLDSLRTCSHLLESQIVPSNTGQGYIVRKFIRRCVSQGMRLDCSSDELWDSICKYWQQEQILVDPLKCKEIWLQECTKLERLFRQGHKPVEKLLKKHPVFGDGEYEYLWETHGLPKDVVVEILNES